MSFLKGNEGPEPSLETCEPFSSHTMYITCPFSLSPNCLCKGNQMQVVSRAAMKGIEVTKGITLRDVRGAFSTSVIVMGFL